MLQLIDNMKSTVLIKIIVRRKIIVSNCGMRHIQTVMGNKTKRQNYEC